VIRELVPTSAFKRDYKRLSRSGRHDMRLLQSVVETLVQDVPLEMRHRDHALTGNWSDHRECHIKPDWLLVYRLEPGKLYLVRAGSHNDLFA